MNKKYKHIKLIIVFLLGFTLISHAVIPHDHHYVNFSNTEQHHKNDNLPIHCNYLNNLDFERVTSYNFKKNLKEFPVVLTVTFYNILDSYFNNQTIKFVYTNDNLPSYFPLLSISPTRGSPLV